MARRGPGKFCGIGIDQRWYAGFIGKDADAVSLPFDFFAQSLQRIGRVEFSTLRGRQSDACQHVALLSYIRTASLGQRSRT
jgi:hypothetical protein